MSWIGRGTDGVVDTAELSTGNFALLGHREVPAVVDGLNEVMKFNE